MKYIIWFIGVVCIIAILSWTIGYSPQIVEGYESFEECKKQGYPHKFCMHVPIQSMITTSPDLHK